MTLPPHRIGDKGQRYAFFIHGWNEDDHAEKSIIFSETGSAADFEMLEDICSVHPVWHTPFIIDRATGQVVHGTRLTQPVV
jgi:hypothetical protein